MSEMTDSGVAVPTLTLGWRLQMALANSPHTRTAIAEALGVDASTVGRWMNDRGAPPKKAYITQWAWLTRVPLHWLETGEAEPVGPDGSPMTTAEWSADPLPFPGFAGTHSSGGSHDTPCDPWQLVTPDHRLAGSTNRRGGSTQLNDLAVDRLRAVAEAESSAADVTADLMVAS